MAINRQTKKNVTIINIIIYFLLFSALIFLSKDMINNNFYSMPKIKKEMVKNNNEEQKQEEKISNNQVLAFCFTFICGTITSVFLIFAFIFLPYNIDRKYKNDIFQPGERKIKKQKILNYIFHIEKEDSRNENIQNIKKVNRKKLFYILTIVFTTAFLFHFYFSLLMYVFFEWRNFRAFLKGLFCVFYPRYIYVSLITWSLCIIFYSFACSLFANN